MTSYPMFVAALVGIGLPEPVEEHRFDVIGKRRWRFDYAWKNAMLAVEIEGSTYTRGRHTRGAGFGKDCEKHNHAALQGWAVLRFTTEDLIKRPIQCVEMVRELYEKRIAFIPDPR